MSRISSFTVIGDPGCDGLGAGIMSIFAKALTAESADLTIVAGDLVPIGSKKLYTNVRNFVNTVAQNPVFALCGNHDTEYYEEYFGRKNYYLYTEDLLLILLDNSKRKFSEETAAFLDRTLSTLPGRETVVFFHIPPPNPVTENSVSEKEWQPLASVLQKHRHAVSYIVTGHVHSYFESSVLGIPLVVTGGGGARIEYVSDTIDPLKAHHHYLQFSLKDGLSFRHKTLNDTAYIRELEDIQIQKHLEEAFSNEATAYVRYTLFARTAEEQGFPGIAKMFRAFADAELVHAGNHLQVMGGLESVPNNLHTSGKSESYEVSTLYRNFTEYCRNNKHGLTEYTFNDAREAEKVHEQMITEALSLFSAKTGRDFPEYEYYTCSSCGYTFRQDDHPKRCPVCGAPKDKLRRVK